MAEELIVLVDEAGREIGTAPKLEAHNAQTKLHKGFSCYVFNPQGKFLLTQRAKTKKVFPGIWTNSVCGHPGPGEAVEAAIERRANFELGLAVTDLHCWLADFRYRAEMGGIMENEICPVYSAHTGRDPKPNPDEVEGWRWVGWDEFVRDIQDQPDHYSPWAGLQVRALVQAGFTPAQA